MTQQGKLLVDGEDAFLEYGIFVEQYGYKALIQMPSFKKLDSTEWPEFDGEEVDLTAPVLDTKTFNIQFCITNVRYAEDFFNCISQGAYHTFYFADLKKSYKLRLTSNGTFSSFIKLGKLTLSFADDFPAVPDESPYEFGDTEVAQFGYELDGIDMSQFGSYILKGTDDSLRKTPNVRSNLSVSTQDTAGVSYDSQSVFFKTKDATLKLLIRTDDIDEFWKRWNALFSVLMQPEARQFLFGEMDALYDCYYSKNSVTKFEILNNGHVWCEFSVVLTFTDCRPISQYMLLATEDDDWVITEDKKDPARILIRPRSGISYLITQSGEFIVTEDGNSRIYVNN